MARVTVDSVLTGLQKLSAAVFAYAMGVHLVSSEAYQSAEGLAATGTLVALAGIMAVHGRADGRTMAKRRLSIEEKRK